MALLWYDRNEAYDTGSALVQLRTNGYMQAYGNDVLGSGVIIVDPGYESNRAFRFHRNSSSGTNERAAAVVKFFGNPDIPTVIVQFRWKFQGEDNSNRTIFAIGHGDGVSEYTIDHDNGPIRHVTVSRNANNGFDVYREGGAAEGGILLIISADDLIVEDTWYHLEFKVTIHELTGTFELRLNGASVAASAYQNTSNSAASSQRLCNWIEFRNNITESHYTDDDQQYIDNLIIMDTKGFRQNDFQGVDYDPRFNGIFNIPDSLPGSPGVPGGDPPPMQPPPDDDDDLEDPKDPPGDGEDNDPGGEPGENTMPAVVGDVEWFQDFSNTIVGPNDLNVAGNVYGNDPGRMMTTDSHTKPDGSKYNYKVTVNDSVLDKRVLEFQGTKEAKQKEGVNHTQIGLYSKRYFLGGGGPRSLSYGKDYKLSFVHNLKFGYDYNLPNNDTYNILWQLFSLPDSGDPGRNPILAYTFIDGDMNVTIRGDSDALTEHPYDFTETSFLYAPVFNEYELIEAFFTLGHAVGTAKLQIFRNGGQIFNDQSTRIGFNDVDGVLCQMGIYHNYGPNAPDVLRRRISAIRLEAM